MPKFLDEPQWYNSSGQVKSMGDYSEIYKPSVYQWNEISWDEINGRDWQNRTPKYLRFTFYSSFSWSIYYTYFSNVYINNSFGGHDYKIFKQDTTIPFSVYADEEIFQNYNGSPLYTASVSGQPLQFTYVTTPPRTLVTNEGFVFIEATWGGGPTPGSTLFEKIEYYGETILSVDCEYLYNEIQTLKS